ncbi:MAG TPA: helix-turn-helix transcriptional regulator [Candidatus Kapabacteria bacterium]|nr:helix-turn-helix transcriptional regulator [Candidatus Kapabacteria bacterium]
MTDNNPSKRRTAMQHLKNNDIHRRIDPLESSTLSTTPDAWFARLVTCTGTTTSYVEMQRLLKDHVREHLIDVDVVCTVVNYRAVADSVPLERANVVADTCFLPDESTDGNICVEVGSESDRSVHVTRMTRELQEAGFDTGAYHPDPHVEWYTLDDGGHLGVILLWNRTDRTPIGDDAVRRLRSIEPYVRWSMLHISALHQALRPTDQRFFEGMNAMTADGGLTVREMQVALYRMNGLENREIADKLGVTINTVETHMKHVFDKTGAGGIMKLYQKYFAPQLVDLTPRDLHQTGDAPP